MKFLIATLLIAGVLVASIFVFVYAGIFNVAADAPHSTFTYTIMETVRSRSIAARAKDVQSLPLDDEELVATGAEHYAAMCSGCHLAPGKKDSEVRDGLYPQPPDLTRTLHASPAEEFWVIKHGIKMSGMPAWGKTHDDSSIWGIVAFLQKLPDLTPAQYQALAKAGNDSGHHHSDDPRGRESDAKDVHDADNSHKSKHHHHEKK